MDSNVEIVIQSNAEKILRILAKIILFIGVLVGIILAIAGVSGERLGVALLAGIGTVLFSVIIWAVLNVLANISAYLSFIAGCYEEQINKQDNDKH